MENVPLKGEDGEYQFTRGLENKGVLTKQKDIMNKQDEKLDEIAGIVKSINYENQNFRDEVGY